VQPSGPPPAVRIEAVHKTFRLPHHRYSTLKERALHPFASRTMEELHAVDGVSVDIEQGEFFGIVGRNGSGKSTLLKCLAGIYETDEGEIVINGRLSPFIELGVGFNPDLTARENVLINAIMLGLTRKQARERFDDIIAFAELEEFLDLKLKNYSSGMAVRLGFAVAIQVDADILLIDEVLAVGDAAFQQKCFDEFVRIREAGKTILLVTHDMGAVHRFCDRAMLLERGRVVEIGDPDDVGNRYLELNFSERARAGGEREEGDRYGDGRATIEEAWFEDADGQRCEVLPAGEPCAFVCRVVFHEQVDNPLFGVNLQNAQRDTVLAASNLWTDPEPGTFTAGEEVRFRITFTNHLAPGRYDATPAVARGGGAGVAWIDRRERFADVLVTGMRATGGLVDLPFELALQR
jgi:ABC-type polysaccharide/polyol phosphate transport system ATPase subunit